MKTIVSFLLLLLGLGSVLSAQCRISSGSYVTIGAGSVLTAVGVDLELAAGATLANQGILQTDQSFTSAGTMVTEVSGTTPGTHYGQVTAEGSASLDGTFMATKAAAYDPTGFVTHNIVLSGTVTGTFATENLPGPNWQMTYAPTAANLIYDQSLPVSWLRFSAETRDKTVLLSWATAAEVNNDHFLVERQTEATGEWVSIGRVPANASQFSSAGAYSFVDDNPPPMNEIPYRLRQVDTDGAFSFSPVEVVRFGGSAENRLVFPNPSDGEVFFSVDPGKAPTLEVYDGAGRLLLRQRTLDTSTTQRFTFGEEWPAGTYFIRLGERVERVVLRR